MAVAFATARLLNGEEIRPSFPLQVAADTARSESRLAQEFPDRIQGIDKHLHSISRCIAHVEKILELPQDQAFAMILDEARNHGPSVPCKRPTMGFAPAALASCFYLLSISGDFHEGLIDIINQGGDADSTGAVLGAMSGAHFGVEGIPQDWLTPLCNREGIDSRARALMTDSTKVDRKVIPDLVETERNLCRQEIRYRQKIQAALNLRDSTILDQSVGNNPKISEIPPNSADQE